MIGLYLVLLLMIVGYAAFSTSLNVSSTAKVTSTWDVEITSIIPCDYKESAYETASFHTGLKLPGSRRYYKIKITNNGSLDARISNIKVNKSDNSAIKLSLSMSETFSDDSSNVDYGDFGEFDGEESYDFSAEDDVRLPSGENLFLVLLIDYDDVTEQPENLNADISFELNYVQAD